MTTTYDEARETHHAHDFDETLLLLRHQRRQEDGKQQLRQTSTKRDRKTNNSNLKDKDVESRTDQTLEVKVDDLLAGRIALEAGARQRRRAVGEELEHGAREHRDELRRAKRISGAKTQTNVVVTLGKSSDLDTVRLYITLK